MGIVQFIEKVMWGLREVSAKVGEKVGYEFTIVSLISCICEPEPRVLAKS